MITKAIETEHGTVNTAAEVTHSDNGQVFIHITSKLGEAVHEHTVTIGAVDGHDSLSTIPEDLLQAIIQKHLDEKRNEAAQVLAGRAKVTKIAANLV